MPVTKAQKEQVVAELVDSFGKAKSVFFSQYQGTNVKNMRSLRKKMHGEKVQFKIARKTLVGIAAKKAGIEEAIPGGMMEGPIGLAFGMGDEIAPARILHEIGKNVETFKIVGAFFEGKFIDAAQAKVIATLPSREVLLAKLMGSMKAPVSGFYSILHGLLRGFVYTLSEVAKKKPAAPAAAEPATPAA